MHSDTTPSEAVVAAESRRSAPQLTFPRPVTGVDLLLSALAVVVGPGVVAVLVIMAGVALDQPWLVGIAMPLATIAAGFSLHMACSVGDGPGRMSASYEHAAALCGICCGRCRCSGSQPCSSPSSYANRSVTPLQGAVPRQERPG